MLTTFLFLSLLTSPTTPTPTPAVSTPTPTPTPWPPQFHALLYRNRSNSLATIDLWYDWPNGRNFNIIQHQLGSLLYDLEWTNGTSFYYTLDQSNPTCRTIHFDVGILTPDWLVADAHYVGRRTVDGFVCDVWEKAEFIVYYEDVETKRPVHWLFLTTGQSVHVMTFEVGAVLEDAKWQAPAYCFNKEEQLEEKQISYSLPTKTMMRNFNLDR